MEQYLSAASAAARAAGKLIREQLGQYVSLQTKATAHDLVTEVDRACEETVSRLLLEAFPGHSFLGEEGVTQGAARMERSADLSTVEYLWVCDPIDGTTNFVHGIPCCTVSIALAHFGEPVLGVVYEPARDELFAAIRGQGATLNGRPIRVSTEQTLGESLLVTGFAVRPEIRDRNVADLVALAPLCRNIRALGSAAMHLAYVASGRLTGFWEDGLHPWDLAAGYVLVTEAGGRMTDRSGKPYTLETGNFLATNGAVHEDVLAVLARH